MPEESWPHDRRPGPDALRTLALYDARITRARRFGYDSLATRSRCARRRTRLGTAGPRIRCAHSAGRATHRAGVSAGHWLGHGEFYGTEGNSAGSGISDGSFTFDLTVGVSGLIVGRMAMETTGSMDNAAATAEFTEISTGNGWVLGGNAGSVTWTGGEHVSGTIHGKRVAMTVPMNGTFQADGHFEPSQVSCNAASGNLALAQNKMTTGKAGIVVNAPWVAVKVDGGEGLHDAGGEIAGWWNVISAMDKAAEADFKGMTAPQLKTLIGEGKQVQTAIKGFLKCGSGQPGLNSTDSQNMLTIFGYQLLSAEKAYAALPGHF